MLHMGRYEGFTLELNFKKNLETDDSNSSILHSNPLPYKLINFWKVRVNSNDINFL